MAAVDDATVFNPGEPVFDQATGEPLIDAEGAWVEVAPGSRVTGPDGRTHDGDDVVNAAYLRANTHERELLRDAASGVPYARLALAQPDPALAASLCVAEVRRRTPGIAGIVAVRVDGLDQLSRVLRFRATMIKESGEGEIPASIAVTPP